MTAAATFQMQNGVVCVIYDAQIPHVHEIALCDDHLMILVWNDPETGDEIGLRMQYPVSETICQALRKHRMAAIGVFAGPRKVEDLHIVPVTFETSP